MNSPAREMATLCRRPEVLGVLVIDGDKELIEQASGQALPGECITEHKERINSVDLDYLIEEMPLALGQARDGLGQIKKIVRAMKDFSHPGDEMEAVDVNQAIESTVTVARNEWKYVAEVELALEANMPRGVCVPSALNQVILNLIVNAAHAVCAVVQASPGEKGRIGITTSIRGNLILICVEDSGCGIPNEICNRIFDAHLEPW